MDKHQVVSPNVVDDTGSSNEACSIRREIPRAKVANVDTSDICTNTLCSVQDSLVPPLTPTFTIQTLLEDNPCEPDEDDVLELDQHMTWALDTLSVTPRDTGSYSGTESEDGMGSVAGGDDMESVHTWLNECFDGEGNTLIERVQRSRRARILSDMETSHSCPKQSYLTARQISPEAKEPLVEDDDLIEGNEVICEGAAFYRGAATSHQQVRDWAVDRFRERAHTWPGVTSALEGDCSGSNNSSPKKDLMNGTRCVKVTYDLQESEHLVCKHTAVNAPEAAVNIPPSYRLFYWSDRGIGKGALLGDFKDGGAQPGRRHCEEDDDSDRSVSILLDGQESTMEFVDMSDREVDEYVAADQIDAYVVVYSVEDHKSFETAIDRLYEIRQEESKHVALILVANKTDLVRTRIVLEEEGRSAATTYDCKYIEVSAAIDHRIDELLVGILKQIRLVQERKQKMQKSKNRLGGHKSMVDSLDSCCLLRASRESVLAKLFRGGDKQASKSCDNLYVL